MCKNINHTNFIYLKQGRNVEINEKILSAVRAQYHEPNPPQVIQTNTEIKNKRVTFAPGNSLTSIQTFQKDGPIKEKRRTRSRLKRKEKTNISTYYTAI